MENGEADTKVSFGPDGNEFIPVAGDFTGNGTDGVALYDQANSTFYIDEDLDGGFADQTVHYGSAEDAKEFAPLAGNWTGQDPDVGISQNLTVYQDDLSGTSDNDTFTADVGQNEAGTGEVSNTLATGDEIDGGAGEDVLDAQLIDQGSVSDDDDATTVAPTTENVEEANLQTIGDGDVKLDAWDMRGVETWSSHESRGESNLTLQNLTTTNNTEDVTIRMDYTQGGNEDQAASLYALFDQNNLLSGETTGDAKIQYAMLDQQAVDNGNGPLKDFPLDYLTFSLEGQDYRLEVDDAEVAPITTYSGMVDLLNQNLQDMASNNSELSALEFQLNGEFTDPGGRTGTYIELVDAEGRSFGQNPGTGLQDDASTGNIYWDQQTVEPTRTELPVIGTVELLKAGSGSDGGELIVGGVSDSSDSLGIEKIDVTVEGNSNNPSSLAYLGSTGDTLQDVVISTSDDVAN